MAKRFGLHPNTIRLYERLGFITSAKRTSNGYREFTETQVLQLKVCRCIFGHPYASRLIRDKGNEVMWALAKRQWDLGRQRTDTYIKAIQDEIALAKKTAGILQDWAAPGRKADAGGEGCFSRKEAAGRFGVTVEAVRNWERNGLVTPGERGDRGEVLYTQAALGRMYVVYMLRQSGYSMAAIRESLAMYDAGQYEKVLPALHAPEPDELAIFGDRWLYGLENLLAAAKKIPPLIDELAVL